MISPRIPQTYSPKPDALSHQFTLEGGNLQRKPLLTRHAYWGQFTGKLSRKYKKLSRDSLFRMDVRQVNSLYHSWPGHRCLTGGTSLRLLATRGSTKLWPLFSSSFGGLRWPLMSTPTSLHAQFVIADPSSPPKSGRPSVKLEEPPLV